MKIAIMQPYFLPYIGYFQLMASVDKFIIFDDVSYINKGWVNRNRLLLNGKSFIFTVPLKGSSQNRLISELELVDGAHWRKKMIKTIFQAYVKAPNFNVIYESIAGIINYPTSRLDHFLLNSLVTLRDMIGLDVNIIPSSRIYNNADFTAQDRIIDICKKESATQYLNMIGGMNLYDQSEFAKQGISLRFVEPSFEQYLQYGTHHIAGLSILDVLMFNPIEVIREMLTRSKEV